MFQSTIMVQTKSFSFPFSILILRGVHMYTKLSIYNPLIYKESMYQPFVQETLLMAFYKSKHQQGLPFL